MQKRVGVVLVNYKNYAERFLSECWDSLMAQDYPAQDFEIVIVDNCSSDKSINFLKKFAPAAVVPRGDGNYAAANNAGIKKARELGCELFVLANMDTVFDESWLSELVKTVISNEKNGIAQSKILLYVQKMDSRFRGNDKKEIVNSLGNHLHYLGFGFTDGYGLPDRAIEGYPEIAGYASGCSFIIKKEVIDVIGGYNEDYYMYHDDIELGWKAKLAGYKIVLAPKSVVYHKYEFSRSIQMLYYMERNRYIAVLTFYELKTLLLILPALIAMDLGMLVFSIFNKWFKIKISVYGYFLHPSTWRKISAERKMVKKVRKVRDAEIINNFVGKVEFQEIDNPVLKYFANPIFNFYFAIIKKILG
jgi:GT2 family glycosyltransferase